MPPDRGQKGWKHTPPIPFLANFPFTGLEIMDLCPVLLGSYTVPRCIACEFLIRLLSPSMPFPSLPLSHYYCWVIPNPFSPLPSGPISHVVLANVRQRVGLGFRGAKWDILCSRIPPVLSKFMGCDTKSDMFHFKILKFYRKHLVMIFVVNAVLNSWGSQILTHDRAVDFIKTIFYFLFSLK